MNYKSYNDYELIYMVRENDDDSRNILYEKYSPILKNIASEFYYKYSVYGYEFDDFLQEAYIAFEKAIIKFDEINGAAFYTFCLLCVRRALISFCRDISNDKRNISSEKLVELDNLSVTDIKSNVIDYIDYLYLEKRIKDLMYSLPFEISCIMELRLNGFSFFEISSLLDVSISTIEFRNRKIKGKLMDLLSNLR